MLKEFFICLVVALPYIQGHDMFGPPPSAGNACKVSKIWKSQLRGLRKHEEFKVGRGFNIDASKLPQKYKLSPEVIDQNGKIRCTAKGWNVDPHHVLVVPAHSHGQWCKVPTIWKLRKITKLHAGLRIKIRCAKGSEYNEYLKKSNGKLRCTKGNWNACTKTPLCIKSSSVNKSMNLNFV